MKKILIAAATLLLLPGLVACGAAADKITEKTIEDQTGSDVEIDGDKVTATTEDGDTISAGQDIDVPDSWPSVVPVPDDAMLTFAGESGDDDGTIAGAFTVENAASAATAYGEKLVSAGFPKSDSLDAGGATQIVTYTGHGYDVTITSTGESALYVSITPTS